MTTAIIIPARMGSTRFPGKPLVKVHGRTMLERVWRIAKQAHPVVYIATDTLALEKHAESFGAEVIMTSMTCSNGTERVAEALMGLPNIDKVINLQGDAVLMPPWVLTDCLKALETHPFVTPAVRLTGQHLIDFVQNKEQGSTTGTMAVFDNNYNALYFSKQLLPILKHPEPHLYQHLGLYGYDRKTLQIFCDAPPSPLEFAENLEQMRALSCGLSIRIVPIDYRGRSHGAIDNPADVALVEKIIETEGELI